MRFMVIVPASEQSEAGILPTAEQFAEMGKFNEEMAKAGILLAADGLQPSSKGARIKFSGTKRTVIDGPFTESKELVAGFWIIQTKSKEEAIEWIKRAPLFDGGVEIEIRQIFEATDFDDEVAADIQKREGRLGEKMAENARRSP